VAADREKGGASGREFTAICRCVCEERGHVAVRVRKADPDRLLNMAGLLTAAASHGKGSDKQFADRDSVIGQWDRTIAVVQFFGGIDSQSRVDGGVQIGNGDG